MPDEPITHTPEQLEAMLNAQLDINSKLEQRIRNLTLGRDALKEEVTELNDLLKEVGRRWKSVREENERLQKKNSELEAQLSENDRQTTPAPQGHQ